MDTVKPWFSRPVRTEINRFIDLIKNVNSPKSKKKKKTMAFISLYVAKCNLGKVNLEALLASSLLVAQCRL